MAVALWDVGFSASSILAYGVSELHLSNVSVSSIAKRYGISERCVQLILGMAPQDLPLFCEIVEARKAATLKVNFDAAADLAENMVNWRPDQQVELNRRYELWFRQRSFSEVNVLTYMYKFFIDYLITALSDVHSSRRRTSLEIPSRLLAAIHDLSNSVWPLFQKGLMMGNCIRLVVDSECLELTIAAYQAKSYQQRIVVDLIRAGADWHFINKYNGLVTVDMKRYRELRAMLGVSGNKEAVTVRKGIDIMSDFRRLMEVNNMATIDVYFNLRRIHKLRIETLYSYIEEVLSEVDSDEEDEDFDFIKALE